MKKRCLCAAVLMALTSGAFAGSYQAEVAGGLELTDADNGNNTTKLGGRGQFYFAPVNNAGKPLAEAAFLSRASNVNGYLNFSDSDASDGTAMGVGAEVYIPRSMVYVAVDYQRWDYDHNDGSNWLITGGVTPIDGLRITTTYNEDSGYDLNLAAVYVTKLGGQQSVKFFGSLVDDDSNTIKAGFHFYFNRQLGAGIQLKDSGDNTDFRFEGDYFLNENTFVKAFIQNSDYEDTFGIEVGTRF